MRDSLELGHPEVLKGPFVRMSQVVVKDCLLLIRSSPMPGRYTAVFAQSNFKNGGYIGLYSQHGFITFG